MATRKTRSPDALVPDATTAPAQGGALSADESHGPGGRSTDQPRGGSQASPGPRLKDVADQAGSQMATAKNAPLKKTTATRPLASALKPGTPTPAGSIGNAAAPKSPSTRAVEQAGKSGTGKPVADPSTQEPQATPPADPAVAKTTTRKR